MGKRLLVFITLLLIAGVFTGWYFFAKESRYFGTSPLRAVPVKTPYFIRVRNLGDFAEKTIKSNSWQSLSKFQPISETYQEFVFLDSLIHRNKGYESFLLNKDLFVVPIDGARILILEIGSITEKNNINAFVKDYFLSKNSTITSERFRDATFQKYEWTEKNVKKRLLVTIFRGLLIATNERASLESAISQLDQPSLLDDSDYLRVNKNSTENTDLNIFINHKTFPAYLSKFFTDSLSPGILDSNYAKWTELDVLEKENQLLLNGFTVTDRNQFSFLDVFKRQKPIAGSLLKIIPAATTSFIIQNVSHPKQYLEDYQTFLKNCEKEKHYQNLAAAISEELHLNIGQYLAENWAGEAAVVFINQNLVEKTDNRFLVLSVNRTPGDAFIAAAKKWSTSRKNKEQDPEVSDIDGHRIWRMPSDSLGELLGSFYFGSVKTSWMTTVDGYIIMGSTPGSLKRYLNFINQKELLQDDSLYKKVSNDLAHSYNFYLWCKPSQSLPLFESLVKPKLHDNLVEYFPGIEKCEALSWQWEYENGLAYNTASFCFNPLASVNKIPFWKYPLKYKLTQKPMFVGGSIPGKSKDLIFTDKGNYLTALDEDGFERWKIKLDGPVMGEVKSLELKKRGEILLVFNTRDAIHQIGGNGKEMKNFPLKLKAGATNELAVFDYDHKGDYRFVIACSDHKIYNFDQYGKATVGWQPKLSLGNVEFPVHHFRVKSKDYIVFLDQKHINIIDRQGKERAKLKDDFVRSGNDISLIENNEGNGWLVTTDEHGTIRLLGLDGSSRKIASGNFSTGHHFFPVKFEGEGIFYFLFLDKQNLTLLDFRGKMIFQKTLDFVVDQIPSISSFGKEKMITLYSSADDKTVLISKEGLIFNNFPASKFTFPVQGSFKDKGSIVNLIGCTSDGFLSNYQMDIK